MRKFSWFGPSILILKKIRRSAAWSKISFGWKLVEGDLEFLAGLQGEDVLALFQGDDPAVDQRLRRFRLAAKVVDDEHAAGGLHLQRCLVGPGDGVVVEVEHVERQFTAGDDGGAFAAHVAAVEAVAGATQGRGIVELFLGGGMHDRVVDGDDLAGIFHGAGHVDLVAKGIADAVGDRGFPVARRAVHQDRAAGADSGAEVRDQVIGQDQVPHGGGQVIAGDLDVTDRLSLDLLVVDMQRDGHRAEIFRLRQGVERARLAVVGQLVAHFLVGSGLERAGRLEKQLFPCHVDQFLGNVRRQADGLGNLADLVDALAEHRLDQDIPRHHDGQFQVFQRSRWWRGDDRRRNLHVHF